MADTTYDVGDVATVTASFTNAAGAAADPTTVTLVVQAPDGTQTTPTPTSAVVGTWTADVSVTQAGTWWYRFEGTGAIQTAGEGMFRVRRRMVA